MTGESLKDKSTPLGAPPLRALAAFNAWMGRYARIASGALLGVMMIVVGLQVVARYGFNNSLSWTEELSKTLMVWTAFLIAPSAYRDGANVSIDMLADAIPAGVRRAIDIIITLLILWIVSVFLIESFGLIERGMKSRAASLPINVGYFYLIVPVSLSALILAGVERLAGLLLAPPPQTPNHTPTQASTEAGG